VAPARGQNPRKIVHHGRPAPRRLRDRRSTRRGRRSIPPGRRARGAGRDRSLGRRRPGLVVRPLPPRRFEEISG